VSLFLQLFAVGLVTSVHCVFMCGGLVLTYAVKGAEDGPWYRRLVPHLVYQGSKILSYATVAVILGGIVALLGRAVDIAPFRNWLMVAAGVYMVLLGIGMTGKVKALRHITPRPPKFLVDALSRNRKKASADAAEGHASLATPLSFGLLTGLMPCAPLIAAQASAMSTGSPLLGALGMIGFGLGTMPLMLAFGFASSLLSRQFQAKLQVVAAVAVMIFGLVILNRGLMVVGSPVTFETLRTAVIGTSPTATGSGFTTAADGVVEIPLTIQNTQFIPQNVSVPSDKPFRLVVDRREANSCSAQLAVPQAGVLANLKDNAVTLVDVPAMKAGRYTLTCGMGMMVGTLSVGGAPASGGGGSTGLVLVVVLAAAGALGFIGYQWRRAGAVRPAPQAAVAKNARAGTAQMKGGKSGKGHAARAPVPAPASAGVTVMGLTPAQLVIASSVVIGAVIIGLASGGFFH
jgi:uncharacterized protein